MEFLKYLMHHLRYRYLIDGIGTLIVIAGLVSLVLLPDTRVTIIALLFMLLFLADIFIIGMVIAVPFYYIAEVRHWVDKEKEDYEKVG